jgi:hypothetical protein
VRYPQTSASSRALREPRISPVALLHPFFILVVLFYFKAASYMASYNRPGQQDDGLHVWRPQQGLEFDSDQNGAKRSGYHDKQPVSSHDHSDAFHDDNETGKTHQKETSRTPFGLSPLLFGLLVALGTAIIIGGAVGGGVGSQIKPSSE